MMRIQPHIPSSFSVRLVLPGEIAVADLVEVQLNLKSNFNCQIVCIDDDIAYKLQKLFHQYSFSISTTTNQSSLKSLRKNPQHISSLESFYDNLYRTKELPESVRQLEKISRYYCYLWLAWNSYAQKNYPLMSQYLLESWQYSEATSSKTINHWHEFFRSQIESNNNLSSLTAWQQLIDRIRNLSPPKVSVIIPSYNCDRYLSTTIESVLDQTYRDYEIIVIDDGSTDLTSKIIDPYRQKIRYFYQENQGAGEARNRGLYLARGELIAFLDADDLFLPHKLQEQVAILEKRSEIGIVNSGFRVIGEDGKAIADIERWHEIPDLTPEDWLLHKPVLPSAMMFRRQWFELVGGFEQCYFPCEDLEIILRMVARGCQSLWLPKITTCYRRYSLSATALNSSRVLKLIQSAEAVQDDFFAREDLPPLMVQLERKSRFYYYCWLAWLCYQSGLENLMSQYLLKSQFHAAHSWIETVSEWINTFNSCAKIYGCDFDAFALSNLPQWQEVLARIPSSALERSYQKHITQVQQLFHSIIDNHQVALYGQTYFQLGQTLLQQHDLERAIISLRRAIELVPNNSLYHHALGTAYQQHYDLDRAVLSYQQALRLKPNHNDFQASLQSVVRQQQQWQKLLNYCQQFSRASKEDSKPKLLMIFPFTPDPEQKGGAAIRMFEQIKYFGSRYQLAIVAFIFNESDRQMESKLEQYCDLALLLEVGTPMSPYNRNRHQQPYFLQTWNMWRSLEKLSQINFDVVFFEFIFTAVYYPLFGGSLRVLNEHNIESQLLQSCASSNSDELIGNLAKRVDAVKPFVNASREAKFLAAYEERMWSLFPLISVVSEEDKQELESRCPSPKTDNLRTLVVKNGVNTEEIQPVNNQQARKILFMGTMSYFPNIDGVFFFVDKIFSLVKQQEPKIDFCIAGREPPAEILTLENQNLGIEIIANPPDMRKVATQCQMTVVPLRIGGGTRIKILHSMAMGLPVISSSLGCEGLEVVDGEHLLIRDNPEDFAAAVLEVANNRPLREKLRYNGRKLVESQYNWQAIFARFEDAIFQPK